MKLCGVMRKWNQQQWNGMEKTDDEKRYDEVEINSKKNERKLQK